MTDHELLELAAKAAGIEGDFDVDCIRVRIPYSASGFMCFSPLTDDGDALRLAVKLRMVVDTGVIDGRSSAAALGMNIDTNESLHGDDPCAATRRAIVRAAAEIGSTK